MGIGDWRLEIGGLVLRLGDWCYGLGDWSKALKGLVEVAELRTAYCVLYCQILQYRTLTIE